MTRVQLKENTEAPVLMVILSHCARFASMLASAGIGSCSMPVAAATTASLAGPNAMVWPCLDRARGDKTDAASVDGPQKHPAHLPAAHARP